MKRVMRLSRQQLAALKHPKLGPKSLLRKKTPRVRRDDPEHRIQCALIAWARTEGAQLHPELEFIYAIPNGGKRGKLTAFKMKKEGLLPGVFDIALDEPRGGFHGAKFETKAEHGTLSRAQKDYMKRVLDRGYYAVVYKSFEEGRDLILGYMAMPATQVVR